jgi:hypothetical protein
MHDCNATLKTHVSYLREAWMSPANNSVRVTFDRQVNVTPHFEPVITTRQTNPVQPWGQLVILELKFTGRFPNWFFEMVRQFNVMQCGVAKYAEGVAVLGEECLNPMFHQPEQADRIEEFIRTHRQPRSARPDAPQPQSSKDHLAWTTS